MRFYVSFLFLITLYGSHAQTPDSLDYTYYKTGSFYVLKGTDTCFISRTETRQIEQCQGSDTSYELIVVWLKKNKYILRDIHYNPTNAPKVMRKDVVMTILEMHPDYYIVRVKMQGQKSYDLTVYCLNNT